MLDLETRQQLREEARVWVVELLKTTEDRHRAVITPKGEITELGKLLGDDRAMEIEAAFYTAASDLLYTRDELSREMTGAIRDLQSAEQFIRGERASFNNLGVLQGKGSTIDRLCGMFDLQVKYAVEARYTRNVAVYEARNTAV